MSLDYIASYARWIREISRAKQRNDVVAIEVPFLDSHNDFMTIYARPSNGSVLLTDYGYILNDLAASGVNTTSRKSASLIESILANHGLELGDSDDIHAMATEDTVAERLHCVIQGMIAISHVAFAEKKRAVSTFTDNVVVHFKDHNVRCRPGATLLGATGSKRRFDLVCLPTPTRGRVLVSTLSSRNNQTRDQLIFHWLDTEPSRGKADRGVVIVNDTVVQMTDKLVNAMKHFDLHPFAWSHLPDLDYILGEAA